MASNRLKIFIKYTILMLAMVVFSCGSRKSNIPKKNPQKATQVKPPTSTAKYITTYAEIAKEEMRKYKIPASITLAQGILESASGKGRLAIKAKNHFGIKCHGWKGKKIYHDDDKSQECFRKYNAVKASYEDHSKFLTTKKRYANLFTLKQNDYKGWARGLKKAGYATDRKYPEKLISLIERYKLYKFDYDVIELKKNRYKVVRVNSGTKIHIVTKGDTLYALSKKYNTTVDAIRSINSLNSNSLTIGQELKIPN